MSKVEKRKVSRGRCHGLCQSTKLSVCRSVKNAHCPLIGPISQQIPAYQKAAACLS